MAVIDWNTYFAGSEGKKAFRSAPLSPDGEPYWHAAACIDSDGTAVRSAVVLLKDPDGEPRRLGLIENGLVSGLYRDADEVMDAVRDLVECEDDGYGSAAAKSYLAGWICADVIGRCLK